MRSHEIALTALLTLAAACAPPDRPPAVAEALPEELLDFVRPDSSRTSFLGRGVWYRYLWSPRGPWAIHLVEADLKRCDLGLRVLRAPSQPGKAGGHLTVTALVSLEEADRTIVAAVNGDFFTPEGLPLGPEVTGGILRTLRRRPVVAWTPGGSPWIGTAAVVADSALVVGWGRADTSEASQVLGGYPELLDGGDRVGDLLVAENPAFAATRHPRTALGFEPDRGRLWLVVVDGRQGDYSLGMTLPELAGLFEALGVPEALNLDGGGSSVLVVGGRAVSRPSDSAGERPVVNGLAIRADEAYCRVGGGI